MDTNSYQQLVDTFFTCDRKQLLEIFDELLSAAAAEEQIAPGKLMSRNYETAQANPEIHNLPGNLKDARDAIFPYFWGTDGWFSPLHAENVKGPANYASLIGAVACLIKNPNLCVDTYSQRSNELEVKAITTLANLLFYHTDSPWGLFTMGGTLSNLYGAKLGIEKVAPGAMRDGLAGHRICGVVSQAAHYSNASLAGWLGIGTANLHVVPTGRDLAMRLDLLEQKLESLYADGQRVAFVNATFGSTDAFGVDDVAGIRRIIDAMALRFAQPAPQLHVDAAVGWALSLLNDYDHARNPFDLEADVLALLTGARERCMGLQLADSVTVDFHKLGWGHYPASAFIVSRRADLARLARTAHDMPYFCEADYSRDPALFTLECSRPAIGPYSVMATLNGLGLTGCQMLVARALQAANSLKKRLDAMPHCKVLNTHSPGPHVVWWVLPRGRDAKAIYERLVAGDMPADERQRYFTEVRRMFDRRAQAMDPSLDVRLSFTSGMGFAPHGVELPAWKAVFFNPKTDQRIVDRLVETIEDMV